MSPIDREALAEWYRRAGELLRGLCYLGSTIALGAGLVAIALGDWHGFTHAAGAACLMLLALGYLQLRTRVFRLESVGVRVKVQGTLELDDAIERQLELERERPN